MLGNPLRLYAHERVDQCLATRDVYRGYRCEDAFCTGSGLHLASKYNAGGKQLKDTRM